MDKADHNRARFEWLSLVSFYWAEIFGKSSWVRVGTVSRSKGQACGQKLRRIESTVSFLLTQGQTHESLTRNMKRTKWQRDREGEHPLGSSLEWGTCKERERDARPTDENETRNSKIHFARVHVWSSSCNVFRSRIDRFCSCCVVFCVSLTLPLGLAAVPDNRLDPTHTSLAHGS